MSEKDSKESQYSFNQTFSELSQSLQIFKFESDRLVLGQKRPLERQLDEEISLLNIQELPLNLNAFQMGQIK